MRPPRQDDENDWQEQAALMGEIYQGSGRKNRTPQSQKRKMTQPAWRSTRAWVIMLMVMIAGLCADLSTKSWSFNNVAHQPVLLDRSQLLSNPNWSPIPPHDGVIAIPGRMLNLRLVLNDGAVFGIGSQQRGFFMLMPKAPV